MSYSFAPARSERKCRFHARIRGLQQSLKKWGRRVLHAVTLLLYQKAMFEKGAALNFSGYGGNRRTTMQSPSNADPATSF